jgi:hypothetical protein
MQTIFKKVDGKRNMKDIATVVLFFMVGWAAMLVLALLEDKIRIDIASNC